MKHQIRRGTFTVTPVTIGSFSRLLACTQNDTSDNLLISLTTTPDTVYSATGFGVPLRAITGCTLTLSHPLGGTFNSLQQLLQHWHDTSQLLAITLQPDSLLLYPKATDDAKAAAAASRITAPARFGLDLHHAQHGVL